MRTTILITAFLLFITIPAFPTAHYINEDGDGQRDAEWDGRHDQGRQVAAGEYVCRLVEGENQHSLSVALVK